MTVIFPVVTEAQREVLGVAIAFSVLAVSAVFLRLLAHHLARKPWTGSDYAIIVACVRVLYTPVMIKTNKSSCSRLVFSPSALLASVEVG